MILNEIGNRPNSAMTAALVARLPTPSKYLHNLIFNFSQWTESQRDLKSCLSTLRRARGPQTSHAYVKIEIVKQSINTKTKMASPGNQTTKKDKKDESFLEKIGGTLARKKKSKEGTVWCALDRVTVNRAAFSVLLLLANLSRPWDNSESEFGLGAS